MNKRQKVGVVCLTAVLCASVPCINTSAGAVNMSAIEISVDGQNSIIDEPTAEMESRTLSDVEVMDFNSPVESIQAKQEAQYTTGFTTTAVNVRKEPNENSEILETYKTNEQVEYVKENSEWHKIKYGNDYAYISNNYVSENKVEVAKTESNYGAYDYDPNNCLTRRGGIFWYEGRKETFYNLRMTKVVRIMRDLGFSEADYPYWIDERGVKRFGPYVMVATNTYTTPKGTIVRTSLGQGIVVDHCVSAQRSGITWYDLATNW